MDALRELAEWSWEGYTERLAAKGYSLYLRKDSKDRIRGYILKKGNTMYKASELGKGRNLTASRITRTWEMLHPKKVEQENHNPKRPVVRKPAPSAHDENVQRPRTVTTDNSPIHEEYTAWQPGRLRAEFEYSGKEYKRYIPEKVFGYFNDEFDCRELSNWQNLQGLAMAFFTLVASPYGQVTGGGGGGSRSDLSWGRDPKEDGMEFARRPAHEALRMIGRQTKNGMRR